MLAKQQVTGAFYFSDPVPLFLVRDHFSCKYVTQIKAGCKFKPTDPWPPTGAWGNKKNVAPSQKVQNKVLRRSLP